MRMDTLQLVFLLFTCSCLLVEAALSNRIDELHHPQYLDEIFAEAKRNYPAYQIKSRPGQPLRFGKRYRQTAHEYPVN
ncbi:unnamed protein product [Soboliphyme baturini]|uniref:Uncharacterized protein n=1 Tax=Soboliphyme baturini TaxID=241478 RepID=A0A183IZ09_9BILA|nr:unnamed protein product [Soboliphyme baturini]